MLIYYLLTCLSFVSAIIATSVPRRPEQLRHVTIRIDGYNPQKVDEYVGTSILSPKGFIVGFEPIAEADRVHHILLYGCQKPFRENEFWQGGQTCITSGHILYAWAKNASPLFLPKGVGFSIGHDFDSLKYIVLQVHYSYPFKGKVMDYSGVKVHFIEERPPYLAGIYLFVSERTEVGIPSGIQNFYVNMSCVYSSKTPIYPFAFRTHTHSMGRVVSAALKNESGWTLIGKSNPQWPQLFNPMKSSLVIKDRDLLAAKCVFDSTKQNKTIYMGNMGSDEMCNFYMMYYRDANMEDPFPNGGICFGADKEEIVNEEYPPEGLSRLPLHPELEHKAENNGKPFGITEGDILEGISGHHLGQVSGLAFDPFGNLVIFHRSERKWSQDSFDESQTFLNRTSIAGTTIWLMKMEGKGERQRLIAEYGQNQFFLPHGIHVNEKNEYFTTDVGAHLVTKWKLTEQGLAEIFSLGTKFIPGGDREHFCLPTGVTTSPADGTIYVSDGYCNSRIMKFAANGKYITQWGEPYDSNSDGAFPAGKGTLGLFALPHDITVNEDGSRIYVSDRQNARVQIFDSNGATVGEVNNLPNRTLFRTVYSAHYHRGYIYFIPGESREKGRIFCAREVLPDLLFSYEPSRLEFQMSHVIRVSPSGRYIYVGEISNDSSGKVLQYEIHGESADIMQVVDDSFRNQRHKGGKILLGASRKIKIFFSLLLFLIVIGGIVFTFSRRKTLYRSGPKHSVLDRAGFKPLRMDYPSSEEEDSDDDDTILSQLSSGARF